MRRTDFDHPRVFVVLATYNGEAFVAEQIESIVKQSEANWTMLIRDDGSTDATQKIVEDVCHRDGRVELLRGSLGRLGPAGNFGVLMQTAMDRGADCVFFADQDDVWHAEKMAEQLKVMRNTELGSHGKLPTLVYSDLAVTNDRLDVIQPSFNQVMKSPAAEQGSFLLASLYRNYIPGCTILANRALLRLALPLPAANILHDHWLALCAAACGGVRCVPRVLMQYRRHGHNVTGTGNASTLGSRILRVARGEPLSSEAMSHLVARVKCARTLVSRLPRLPNCPHQSVLAAYVQAFEPGRSALERVRRLRQMGLPYRCGLTKQMAFYLRASYLDHFMRKAA